MAFLSIDQVYNKQYPINISLHYMHWCPLSPFFPLTFLVKNSSVLLESFTLKVFAEEYFDFFSFKAFLGTPEFRLNKFKSAEIWYGLFPSLSVWIHPQLMKPFSRCDGFTQMDRSVIWMTFILHNLYTLGKNNEVKTREIGG